MATTAGPPGANADAFGAPSFLPDFPPLNGDSTMMAQATAADLAMPNDAAEFLASANVQSQLTQPGLFSNSPSEGDAEAQGAPDTVNITHWSRDLNELPIDLVNGGLADLELYKAEEAAPVPGNQEMQGFAKLQFADGDFYINTYAVDLGRDENVMKHESRRRKVERRRRQQVVKEQEEEAEQAPDADITSLSNQPRVRDLTAMSASNVSEAGGIMGVNVYSSDEESRLSRKRRRRFLHSEDSSLSQSVAPANLHNGNDFVSFTSNLFANGDDAPAEVVDEECPMIPIHRPGCSSMKNISRKHIRIAYNMDKEFWEMHVQGRNGAIHDEQYHGAGDIVKLHHESEIMIHDIRIVFKLPDNARDNEGPESYESDSPISSLGSTPLDEVAVEDFSDASSAAAASDEEERGARRKSGEAPRVKIKLSLAKRPTKAQKSVPKKDKPAKSARQPSKSGKDEPPPKPEAPATVDKAPESAGAKTSIEKDDTDAAPKKEATETPSAPPAELPPGSILAGLAPEEIPQKRKGPGRPPKNGVMSKRDEAIIKRKKKEYQKAGKEIPPLSELLAMARAEANSTPKKDKTDDVPGDDQVKPSIEARAGQGRDDTSPTLAADGNIEGNLQGRESAEADGRSRRPAKSPSPQKPESEYSEEELKKPLKTYVVLIHEAISKSDTGIMDLQQIYDAIQKMYPYYKYRSTTQGWQSSIRHNLIGSEGFEEAGKIGKGRLWKINPSFPIDKEKKRKAPTPPPERPAYQNPYYPNSQYPYGGGQNYSPYRPSPYGTPYGPPTTLPNGARPPVPAPTAQRPAYYSPYASNPPGQTHASPYGPPSRPPYAQTATQAQPPTNGGPSTTNGGSTPQPLQRPLPPNGQQLQQAPQSSLLQQPQQPSVPTVTTQPHQQAQQQTQSASGALASDHAIEDIMTYHKRYVNKFKLGEEQDAARSLFRKAVNRHINTDKKTLEAPFESPEEEMICKHIGIIIEESKRSTPGQAAAAAAASAGATANKTALPTPSSTEAGQSRPALADGTPQPITGAQQSQETELVEALKTAATAGKHAAAAAAVAASQANVAVATSGTATHPIDIDGGKEDGASRAVGIEVEKTLVSAPDVVTQMAADVTSGMKRAAEGNVQGGPAGKKVKV